MQLRNLFTDDDAVSPVIGVILMVAITVILAAVIGAFVLGFGPGGDAMPQSQWTAEEDPSAAPNGTVTFEHVGGDPVDSGLIDPGKNADAFNGSPSGTLGVGDTIVVEVASSAGDGDVVSIVWSGEGSSEEQVLVDHRLTDDGW